MADNNDNYIDVQLFERLVPIFQDGEAAKSRLESGEQLDRQQRVELRTKVDAGSRAFEELYGKIQWLAQRVVRDEMAKPHNFHVVLEQDDLMQAAMEGAMKMLRNADVSKMNSGINYLLNWMQTSVTRSAARNESAYGLPMTKLCMFRKIAAVRSTMGKEMGRPPTDEEVLDYFHSGKADWKTRYGKRNSNKSRFHENANLKLSVVQEQNEFNTGHPWHTAVSDPIAIDREISSDSGIPGMIKASMEDFWTTWFRMMGIPDEQRDLIVVHLGLYPSYSINAERIKRRGKLAERLSKDFMELAGSEAGQLAWYTDIWESTHGEGPWSAFASIGTDDITGGAPELKSLKTDILMGEVHEASHENDSDNNLEEDDSENVDGKDIK